MILSILKTYLEKKSLEINAEMLVSKLLKNP
jgi:hypothetical protein